MILIEEVVKVVLTWQSHISWLLSPYRTIIFIVTGFIIPLITYWLFKKSRRETAIDFFIILSVLILLFTIYDDCIFGADIIEALVERFVPLCMMVASFYGGSKKDINRNIRTLLIIIFTFSLAVYVYRFILTSVIPTDYICTYGHEYRKASFTRDIMWCIGGSALSYMAAKYRPYMLLLTAPLPLFYFGHLITDIYGPYSKTDVLVGTAGYYVYLVYLLIGFFIVAIVLGILQNRKRRAI